MRKVNLKIQMHNLITQKLAQGVGVSRHAIKQELEQHHKETGELLKDHSIHSINTAESYRDTVDQFATFLKEKHQDVWNSKDLSNITKEISYQFLQERQERGLSAWTISKDLSAINKLLEQDLTKKEANLQLRNTDDITRSREARDHDNSYNANNYKDQIELSNAFGLRRESIYKGQYAVKDVSLFKKNDKVYCSVVEKGGRYREAQCLREYQQAILSKYNVQERESLNKEQFKDLYASSSNKLFDSYTTKIDNHAIRFQYATNLYNQILEEKGIDKQDYSYKNTKFDSEALREVSRSLGHNRISVAAMHYIR